MTLEAPRVSDPPILAADRWPTNAALIRDCARLGYLPSPVLDCTWGKGAWWAEWRPERLVGTDRRPRHGAQAAANFTRLPFPDATFAAVTYDPPYVAQGGRRTSTVPGMADAYGMHSAPATPQALQELIDAGLAECARVVRPGGFVLVKCKDYVSSGRLFEGTFWTRRAAEELGLVGVDRFEHVGVPGPQPTGRTRADGRPVVQQHARRNLSTLLVLRRRRGATAARSGRGWMGSCSTDFPPRGCA